MFIKRFLIVCLIGLVITDGYANRKKRKVFKTAHPEKVFHLWAMSDPHVFSEKYLLKRDFKRKGLKYTPGKLIRRKNAYNSIATPLKQSEGKKGFDWDIGLMVGDISGSIDLPTEAEGKEIVKQFGVLKKHNREDFYTVCGNHDNSPDNLWFRKWLDPNGKFSRYSGVDNKKRKYKVYGTWERYSFQVGNLLFLVMADRNDYPPPVGCIKDGKATGGHPAGAVTKTTFNWWKKMVESNQDKIIITVHHHMLKATTIGSGEMEGFDMKKPGLRRRYHGYFPEDGVHNKGAGYLYWLIDDTQKPHKPIPDAQVFEKYLAANPGAISLWIGGHTHSDPDDKKKGRTHFKKKWGVHFVNVAALSKHHGGDHSLPMSRLFSFIDGRKLVRVQCYLHTDHYAERGFYPKAEKYLTLDKAFQKPK